MAEEAQQPSLSVDAQRLGERINKAAQGQFAPEPPPTEGASSPPTGAQPQEGPPKPGILARFKNRWWYYPEDRAFEERKRREIWENTQEKFLRQRPTREELELWSRMPVALREQVVHSYEDYRKTREYVEKNWLQEEWNLRNAQRQSELVNQQATSDNPVPSLWESFQNWRARRDYRNAVGDEAAARIRQDRAQAATPERLARELRRAQQNEARARRRLQDLQTGGAAAAIVARAQEKLDRAQQITMGVELIQNAGDPSVMEKFQRWRAETDIQNALRHQETASERQQRALQVTPDRLERERKAAGEKVKALGEKVENLRNAQLRTGGKEKLEKAYKNVDEYVARAERIKQLRASLDQSQNRLLTELELAGLTNLQQTVESLPTKDWIKLWKWRLIYASSAVILTGLAAAAAPELTVLAVSWGTAVAVGELATLMFGGKVREEVHSIKGRAQLAIVDIFYRSEDAEHLNDLFQQFSRLRTNKKEKKSQPSSQIIRRTPPAEAEAAHRAAEPPRPMLNPSEELEDLIDQRLAELAGLGGAPVHGGARNVPPALARALGANEDVARAARARGEQERRGVPPPVRREQGVRHEEENE